MSDPNTRKEKRTPVTLKIKFKSATLDQFIERYSVDVSHGGIFIRTKDPLAVGTQLRFEFQLQDASPLISGEGTVVWTREHDPARVGVAPGMGVRFDKLATESQAVLDKILAMKGKDAASQEPKFEQHKDDPKTRIAPAPLVSGLQAQSAESSKVGPAPSPPSEARRTVMGLGPALPIPPAGGVAAAVGKAPAGKPNTIPAKGPMAPSKGGFPDEGSKDHTPLPKPMPFSSVDDDFSEEAFNQPTRVAGSFEDLLRKAEEEAARNERGEPVIGGKKTNGHANTVPKEPAIAVAGETTHPVEDEKAAEAERHRAKAAEAEARRAAEAEAAQKAAEIKAEEEAELRAATAKATAERERERRAAADREREKQAAADKESARPVAATTGRPGTEERVLPSVEYDEKKKRGAPIGVIAGVLLAAAAAGAYVYVTQKKEPAVAVNPEPAGETPPTPPPADTPPVDPVPAVTPPVVTPDAAPVVPPGLAVELTSTPPGATVEVDGKPVGVTPTSAPGLEAGKTYNLVFKLGCFADQTVKLVAKDGVKPVAVTLKALPRVLRVESEPKGSAIWVDGASTGKVSPADVPLKGAVDKAHKVTLKKAGFAPADTEITTGWACAAENGKGVLLASLTLNELPKPVRKPPAQVEKPAPADKPAPVDKPAPKPDPVAKPKPTPSEEPPLDVVPNPSKPPEKPPVPADKPPEKPPEKDKPGDEHTPDWMKEG